MAHSASVSGSLLLLLLLLSAQPSLTATLCHSYTGGANQNTIRVAQWILQRRNATTFFGCVGNDKMGVEMKKKAEEVGVRIVYQIDKEESTGTRQNNNIPWY